MTNGKEYNLEQFFPYLINAIVMLALTGGTAQLVFTFIANVTTSMTGSPLVGLFSAGLLSTIYSVVVFMLLYKLMRKIEFL